MEGKVWLRIVAALVLIAAVAGITFFAYQAGVVHGSPITVQAPNGQTAPAPYPYYGYGMPWHVFPFFGFGFGCFGPLIALFLLFIALRAISFIFWGPRWGWGHRRMWRHGWYEEGGVPPMFKEMHDRAHGKPDSEKKEE
jgi:amino acid transporter